MDQPYSLKKNDIPDMQSNILIYTTAIVSVPILLSIYSLVFGKTNMKNIIIYSIDLIFIVTILWLSVSTYLLYNFVFSNIA